MENNPVRDLLDKVRAGAENAVKENNFDGLVDTLRMIENDGKKQGYDSTKKFVEENMLYENSNRLIATYKKESNCIEGVVLNLSKLGVNTEKIFSTAKALLGFGNAIEAIKEYNGMQIYVHNGCSLIGIVKTA
jgi:hypothetical protein